MMLLASTTLLQEGTVDDTFSYEDLVNLMIIMLGSQKRIAARDMSMATWMTMTIGRGDDARLVFLPDLLKPLWLRVLGEPLKSITNIHHAITHCSSPLELEAGSVWALNYL